jgi:hypothetical protein
LALPISIVASSARMLSSTVNSWPYINSFSKKTTGFGSLMEL